MRGILVSDFDGTLTRLDFFRLVVERLLPKGVPDYWQEYCAGRMTHFEVMRTYYGAIGTSEAETLSVAEALDLEPDLGRWVKRLGEAGWKVVIASAGCQWYIRHLLKQQGVQVEAHANPGRFVEGQGLLMELPVDSPYFSPSHGIDKAAVVQAFQRSSEFVAFAGDGYPDIEAAKLVTPELRFATASLAFALEKEGLPFRRFDRWAEAKILANE